MVYDAVYAAQQAGIEAAKPGAKFSDVHAAAVRVIAEHLEQWGLLPVSAEESLTEDGGQHRRWMVHGTSHHLGLDVHDCAQARRENYREATLRPGMVLTVEPGLYFKADDERVPERLRGIGVRIEDDIVITETGRENLTAGLPRTSAEVEHWMAEVWAGSTSDGPP
jgi:Xaa-Pro aminopeptidase